jgi:dihydropteroate synthase
LTAPSLLTPSQFVFEARDKRLLLGERTAVMGVINVTPDSFFGNSRKTAPAEAIDAALEMIEAGASIIDLGGESTRPGAQSVPVKEEIRRLSPVLTELRRLTKVLISIDTRKSEVAEAALDLGADIVNDVTSLRGDTRMAEIVARSRSGLVLMHMKGRPETMQRDPVYGDAVEEIRDFLIDAVMRAEQAGISPDSILIDPGIGFGKTAAHNLQVLNRLDRFASLGKPILVGTSRKTFIGKVLDLPPEDRLHGTAATVAAAVLNGAHVVRVHDVAEMLQVCRVADAIKNEALVTSEPLAISPPPPSIRRLVRRSLRLRQDFGGQVGEGGSQRHYNDESEGGQTEAGNKGGVV